jgi:cyanate lyase
MAPYDNVQQVMVMLNSILGQTEEYSLTFGTVSQEEGNGSVVRRPISLRFRSSSYDAAKAILQQLHDSDLRCMLDDVSISTETGGQGVTVTAVLVFFEYQPSAVSNSAS